MSIYVGVRLSTESNHPQVRTVFTSATGPTHATHGHRFIYVIGPFRTRQGAEFMALYGANNPHCQHVDDAERLAAYKASSPRGWALA